MAGQGRWRGSAGNVGWKRVSGGRPGNGEGRSGHGRMGHRRLASAEEGRRRPEIPGEAAVGAQKATDAVPGRSLPRRPLERPEKGASAAQPGDQHAAGVKVRGWLLVNVRAAELPATPQPWWKREPWCRPKRCSRRRRRPEARRHRARPYRARTLSGRTEVSQDPQVTRLRLTLEVQLVLDSCHLSELKVVSAADLTA